MPLASDLVIGKASGPDQYTFGLLSEIAEDAQGFIYALDPLYARIQVYDSIGRYRATIGAKGWGPGEFQAPESFVLSRERLVVRDVRKGLYFILESSGKLSATLPAQLEGSVRRKLRVDTLGHLFDLRDNLRDPHGPRLAVFDLINLGAPADTVQLPPIPLDTFWIRGIGEGQGFSAVIPQPLMAQFYWTVLPDGAVVYALGSQYTLTILRHGQGPQTIERPGSIVKTPSADRREELKRLQEYIRRSCKTARLNPKPYLDRLKVPEHFPPVLGLDSDPDGRIWVRIPHPRGIKNYRFEVLDAEGRLLGRFDISANGDLEADRWFFGRKRIYAAALLDNGVNSLVGFRLPAQLRQGLTSRIR